MFITIKFIMVLQTSQSFFDASLCSLSSVSTKRCKGRNSIVVVCTWGHGTDTCNNIWHPL